MYTVYLTVKKYVLPLIVLLILISSVVGFVFYQMRDTLIEKKVSSDFTLIDNSVFFDVQPKQKTKDYISELILNPTNVNNIKAISIEIVDDKQQLVNKWVDQEGNQTDYFSFSYEKDSSDRLIMRVQFDATALKKTGWNSSTIENFLRLKIVQLVISQQKGYSFDKSYDEAIVVINEKQNIPNSDSFDILYE